LTLAALLAVVTALLAQAALAWEAQQAVSTLALAVFSVQFSPARNEIVAKAANVRQTISFFIGIEFNYTS
jgi:hypothetical protein